MNELKQVLRQAVEALQGLTAECEHKVLQGYAMWCAKTMPTNEALDAAVNAIAAAEAAMAQPEPEPVARIRCWTKDGEGHAELEDWEFPGIEQLPDGAHLLYASAPTQSAEMPPWPEMDDAHDLPHCSDLPASWDDDTRRAHTDMQVARRNCSQLRGYARLVRDQLAAVTAERDEARRTVKMAHEAGESVTQRQPLTDCAATSARPTK